MFTLTQADYAIMAGVHKDLFKVIERAARLSNIRFKVTEGLRSVTQQRKNIAKGVSWTMNSRHLDGHALDIVPMVDVNNDGKISVSEMYSWPLYYKLAETVKRAAKELGISIEWGGDWKKNKDGPHWQLPFKQYPSKKPSQMTAAQLAGGLGHPEVTGAEPTEELTEDQAQVRTIATVAGGASGGATVGYEPVVDVVNTLAYQQGEITSGQVLRIVIALVIVGIAVWVAWKQWKS